MSSLSHEIRRYLSLSSLIDMLERREIALIDPQSWDDKNDRYFMALYKERKEINGLYGMCAARCGETYHHWRVFTEGKDGACVAINRLSLENSLMNHSNIRFGDVDYLYLKQVKALQPSDAHRLPFLKRAGFEPEAEYRVIAESDAPQSPVLAISIELKWIIKIYLNPWMPSAVATSVKAILHRIPGCSKLSIVHSHLTDNEQWKNAGDGVVGRRAAMAHRKLELPKSE